MASSAEATARDGNEAPLRIGIVAGEASGDILGAGLIQSIKQRYPQAVFEGIAGPLMQAAGCRTLFPMEELSVMGLVEVLRHLPRLLGIRRDLIAHFHANPPDLFIGVDAPDFNFGVEAALRRHGVPTVHYVSPSVWAWREYRVKKIARSTDLMLTLFPFEVDFYRRHRVPAVFVGHPLADLIGDAIDRQGLRRELGLPEAATVVALLPGSRRSEVARLITPFLAAAVWLRQRRPEMHFVIPAANAGLRDMITAALGALPSDFPVTVVDGRSRDAMGAADAVLLASGTATLEALMLKRPMVVAYRLARLTYWLAKRLMKSSYYSLPNYLAGRAVVPEITQDEVTGERLGQAMLDQLDSRRGQELTALFTDIHHTLRRDASHEAARAVLELIQR